MIKPLLDKCKNQSSDPQYHINNQECACIFHSTSGWWNRGGGISGANRSSGLAELVSVSVTDHASVSGKNKQG